MRSGPPWLLIILAIILVFCGFKQLSGIAKAVVQSKKILKEDMTNDNDESESKNDQQLLADSVTAEDDKEL